MFHVLLYYKIGKVANARKQVEFQREVCKALGLKGRILINEQGINGTVGGDKIAIDRYRAYMDEHRYFQGIDFKESTSDIDPFPRLKVRYREEIITTEDTEHITWNKRGNHITRDEFHKWLSSGEDMVILDMRNDYEWEIGRFKDSIKPPMKYFRDLKDNMEFYSQFKDRKIVMFCTGGIRCEPASAMFIQYGFDPKNIYQLEGGIVKYAEKYGNEGFYEGKCFVFDDRIAIDVNTSDSAVVLGNCHHCAINVDSYRNCANKHCNQLFIACESCNQTYQNTCGEECQHVIQNPDNMRPPTRKTVQLLHRNK